MTAEKIGYYRKPCLGHNNIIFVCEADLWSVSQKGGQARRLTVNNRECNTPMISPDGKLIAFTARDEGITEIYVMPVEGGVATRLTYQGVSCHICQWTIDGQSIIYASMAEQPFMRYRRIWKVDHRGGSPQLLPYGQATSVSLSTDGGVILCRAEQEYSIWKRYRGGKTGALWIDINGSGDFKRILHDFSGNLCNPIWLYNRIFFLSDYEGHGNLYSCLLDGSDIKKHTDHKDYYPRAATSNGHKIVYQCGGDIYTYDPETSKNCKIDVYINSSKPQMKRKFVEPQLYWESYELHPQGHSSMVTTRGKSFFMGNWEREVTQLGTFDGVRYRYTQWLPEGDKIITVSDAGGEEAIEIHDFSSNVIEPVVERLEGLDTGRILSLKSSPCTSVIAFTNQRNEIIWLDMDGRKLTIIDTSDDEPISDYSFSPDGLWIVYCLDRHFQPQLYLYNLQSGQKVPISNGIGRNISPCFDPDGKYLFFISYRTFNPVYDTVRFDIGYPLGARPYLVTLNKDDESPFDPLPRPFEKEKQSINHKDTNDTSSEDLSKTEKPDISIDCEGINNRIIPFPVKEGKYKQIAAAKGKVFYSEFPVQGSLISSPTERLLGTIKSYSFDTLKEEVFVEGVDEFKMSLDGKTMAYKAKDKLRVVSTNGKPDEKDQQPGRSSGWVDLNRIKLSIVPTKEWQQMFRELWRLQRDHFWTPSMSQVDWESVYHRYRLLLDRIATREEFSDLAWEIHGELGTSHTYEIGGDLPENPNYGIGQLGANFLLKDAKWIIDHIVRGDSWDPDNNSPLNEPGLNVENGDELVKIEGQKLSPDTQPGQFLVNKIKIPIVLTIRKKDGQLYNITVKPTRFEFDARYREWVNDNRKKVHKLTQNKIGYIHIPDMGPNGFAEFSRTYLEECNYPGLIVDVRYNAGGHNSQLIIEKLSRKRVGYSVSHHSKPMPLPMYSVLGPIVALVNEDSGSDGDIFSHVFKTLGLGTVIGKRTWGGVVGISSRDKLVDGALVTQPEFAIWFYNRGFGIENHGAEPDIEVELTPQDFNTGHDAQLNKAIDVILAQMKENPPQSPDFKHSIK